MREIFDNSVEKLHTISVKKLIFQILLALYSFAAVADFKPWINWGYILFLFWFYWYKEEFGLCELWREKLFRGTIFVYSVFVICFLVPNILNESWGGIREANDYVNYMLPAIFLVVIAYRRRKIDGILFGVLIAMMYVCLRAGFAMLILKNFSGEYMWYRNFFAGWILILSPCLIALQACLAKSKILKVVSFTAIFFAIFLLLICGCRGAAIAGILMLIVGIKCVRDIRIRKALFAITVFVVGFLAILYCSGYLQVGHSDMGRIYLWQGAINMFMEHPWIGVGFDQWNYQYMHYFLPYSGFESHIVTPHNIILELLDKEGIVGLVGFVILLVVQSACLWQYTKKREGYQYCVAWAGILCTLGCFFHGMVDNVIFTHICMKAYCFFWGVVILLLIREKQSEIMGAKE